MGTHQTTDSSGSSFTVDTANVHKIYSGSTELSPFHACYANEHTLLRTCAGRFFVHYNGENTTEAYWALRQRAVLYDVPERPWEISGPDSAVFLEKIFARRIANMEIGRGRYVIACTSAGKIFMDGILFRQGAERFWFVQPDGDMHTWLLAHTDGFDVRISNPQSRVLQLQGPNSFGVMQAASDGAIDQGMRYFHSGFFSIGGQSVYVSRTGWTGELGFEIYTLGNQTDCPRLWKHLQEIGKPSGMIFSSMHSMNIRRIEAGILDCGSDFDTSMTPFEAGLNNFIDLDKENFIGRAALLNSDKGKRLYSLLCDTAIPSSGCTIFENDTQVGFVTTGAQSPYLRCGIGNVRFDRAADWVGKTLTMRSKNGEKARCKIVEPPYYDHEKKIPRGEHQQDFI